MKRFARARKRGVCAAEQRSGPHTCGRRRSRAMERGDRLRRCLWRLPRRGGVPNPPEARFIFLSPFAPAPRRDAEQPDFTSRWKASPRQMASRAVPCRVSKARLTNEQVSALVQYLRVEFRTKNQVEQCRRGQCERSPMTSAPDKAACAEGACGAASGRDSWSRSR